MSASTAEAAYGTTIAYTDGASEAIGEVTSISGLSLSVDTIDVTSHDSDDAYREFVAGLIEPGEITIEGNHIAADAGQIAILTHLNARSIRAMAIVYPDASDWAFSAACTAYSAADAAVDGKLSFSATFKVSGVPTLSAT
jgi:predicted secreted protein